MTSSSSRMRGLLFYPRLVSTGPPDLTPLCEQSCVSVPDTQAIRHFSFRRADLFALMACVRVFTWSLCMCTRAHPSFQEVMELGDDASTDSGWGGTSSSSGEERSSEQEQRRGSVEGDDDERSTSGGCSPARRSDASSVVSGPELAVFLFQGGVKGSSRGGDGGDGDGDDGGSDVTLEAKRESNPSSAAPEEEEDEEKDAAAQFPPLFPSSKAEDLLFEYSGSGRGELPAKASGDLRAGELSGAVVGNATTTRASGETAGAGGEEGAAEDEPHVSERLEKMAADGNGREDADAGTKSSSLTGALRGLDLVGSLLNKWTGRATDDGRDDEHPLQQRREEETGQGEGYPTYSSAAAAATAVAASEGGPHLDHHREDDQRPSR